MKKCLIAGIAACIFMLPNAYAASHGGGDAKSMIAAAKTEMGKAKKAGFLWRDVGKFIEKAEAALKKGDAKKAMKLAAKAKFQSQAGLQQAKDQANAGPRF